MLLEQICDVFGVNKDWIVNGTGEKFRMQLTDRKIEGVFKRILEMPERSHIKRFVATLSELTPDEWERIEQLIELAEDTARKDTK